MGSAVTAHGVAATARRLSPKLWPAPRQHCGAAQSDTSAGGIFGVTGAGVAPGRCSCTRLSTAACLMPAGPSPNTPSSRVVIAVNTRCTTSIDGPGNVQPGSSPQIHHWVPEENTPAPLGAV